MLAHHVLFWVKADTTADQKAAFRKGLESLEKIETIKQMHVGVPAAIERAVVETTYTFSLVLFFEDMAGHNVYQEHPVHKAFLDGFRVFFEKVIIYDSI